MINNSMPDVPTSDQYKHDSGAQGGPTSVFRHRRGDLWMCVAAGVSIGFAGIFLIVAIWPRYKDPITRLYSTRLGYSTVAREFDCPFPVKAVTAQKRKLASSFQGEGTLSSEPVLVPVVPLGRILRVHANVGDTVKAGQILLEVDDRLQQVKIAEARSTLDSALHEKERVAAGTPYTLERERPEREKIRLETQQSAVRIYNELLAMDRFLNDRSYVSKRDLLLDQLESVRTEGLRKEQEFYTKIGEKGIKESLAIADNSIELARLALTYRELELTEFKVCAPCAGVIERRFVHEREYNQGPGTPAFVIDESAWFEARLDQTTIGRFAVGERANVYLQAFPEQPLPGTIGRIIPIVNYDLGGPKTTRPVRPLGTGAPEWPSTYAVRIKLEPTGLPIVQGLTGFARICPEREVTAVPAEALFARSGRTGLVYTVNHDSYTPRKVVFGATSDGWVEITSGLEPGTSVLADGYQLLRPADRVELTHRDGQPQGLAAPLKFAKPD